MKNMTITISAVLLCVFGVCAFSIAQETFTPDQPTPSDEVLQAMCQNNLKQWGLIYKMFALEHRNNFPPLSGQIGQFTPERGVIFPEYCMDPGIMLCPGCHETHALKKETDPSMLWNDHSYVYLGYVILERDEAEAFLRAYRTQALAGDSFDKDLKDPETGISIHRITEGVERLFITDINNPIAGALIRSKIPVMGDRMGQHKPDGVNVLFLDGHVEFWLIDAPDAPILAQTWFQKALVELEETLEEEQTLLKKNQLTQSEIVERGE